MTTIINPFAVHCVGSCYRMRLRDLTGLKPMDVSCDACGSDRIAIWRDGECLYSHTGSIDYPIGRQVFGAKVRGPKHA